MTWISTNKTKYIPTTHYYNIVEYFILYIIMIGLLVVSSYISYIIHKNNNIDTNLGSFETKFAKKYIVKSKLKLRFNSESRIKIIPKNNNVSIRFIYLDRQNNYTINKQTEYTFNDKKPNLVYLAIIEGDCIVYDI
jgi:hypothetical protein